MEGKKISFGFMKTKKVDKLPVQEKKDYIECVEEKSIKVVGGDEVLEIAPLIIPMKPNTLITTERLKEIGEKVESALQEPETTEAPATPQEKAPENETLEQMAVRELLEDSKKAVKVDTPQLTLLLPAKSVSSGEKESTLDDYESVPVQEFGLAMLRGMGWTKTSEKSSFKPPQLRPKGLGLGADKVVKDNNKQKATNSSKGDDLTIVKNAFVKITTGKYNGYYGKVVSLDEDNGRVMVDITVIKETVSLSEFMMHPVTKSEFDKESKVLNANSFEQYKKNEGQTSSKNSEKESSSSSERNRDYNPKYERESNSSQDIGGRREKHRDRSNREKHRDSSEVKHSKKNKRYSSQESLSDSDSEINKKKEQRTKKRYSSMESLDSDTERNNKKKERRRHDSDSESDRRIKKGKERKRRDTNSESDRKSKKIEKERRHVSNSDSDHKIEKHSSDSDHRSHTPEGKRDRSKRSDTPEGKRDIDKKRKGKKKKRDRDRSPSHRKHRK